MGAYKEGKKGEEERRSEGLRMFMFDISAFLVVFIHRHKMILIYGYNVCTLFLYDKNTYIFVLYPFLFTTQLGKLMIIYIFGKQ